MNPAKWMTLISIIYLFCLTARGARQEFYDLQDTEEVKLKKSDKVIECDKGKCKGSKCGCCPGYGVKESGLWFKSYSCEKCNCGEDFGCSFSWLGKTCVCPSGYSFFKGFCRAFTVVKWMFSLLYFVVYFVFLIGFTLLKWIFYLLYFLTVCLYLIAYTAVKCLYSLLYNGAIILLICWLILPLILKIDFNDYFLLWQLIGSLFLNKFEERQNMHLSSTVRNANDIYIMICDLLKKIFELKTDEPQKNTDEIALKDFMYHCPICLGSQIEILLEKGSFYTMKCGHIYCNSCIKSMVGTTNVTCAVCKETCKRESFQKIFLL